jgi:hypothetical protein
MYFCVYFIMVNNNLYIYCLIYILDRFRRFIFFVQGEYRNTVNNSGAHKFPIKSTGRFLINILFNETSLCVLAH